MWYREVLVGIIGLCGGAMVAVGLAAFIMELKIIPRYAGITHTADRILLYEDSLLLGTIIGNLLSIYEWPVMLGKVGLIVVGVFFGIFLGSWIIALAEVVNAFSIMARRVGLTKGTGWIVLSIAAGKTLGSLIQFFILK